MNNLLVTIMYHPPGYPPCITSSVVPVQSHYSLTSFKEKIENQYRNLSYYKVTITVL